MRGSNGTSFCCQYDKEGRSDYFKNYYSLNKNRIKNKRKQTLEQNKRNKLFVEKENLKTYDTLI